MRVALRVARNCPTSPAACQVVPQVSLPCSSRTTSVHPSLVRWYAVLAPAMPPPTTTTCAFRGQATFSVIGDSASEGGRKRDLRAGCLAQCQRGDTGDDACRAGQPAPAEAFLEPDRAKQGGKQHRCLAQRCNGGDRRTGHGPKHDRIGRQAAAAAYQPDPHAAAQVGEGGPGAPADPP